MKGELLGILTFPGGPEQVARVRRHVRLAAADHLGLPVGQEHSPLDDLELLVSEVVTNALRHSRSGLPDGRIQVAVQARAASFRVEVTDQGGDGLPEVRSPDAADTSGRGMFLVQALSEEWGVFRGCTGTTTWFEVVF